MTLLHSGDLRNVDMDKLLEGVDYVMNFAALVGEHICKKYPEDAQVLLCRCADAFLLAGLSS